MTHPLQPFDLEGIRDLIGAVVLPQLRFDLGQTSLRSHCGSQGISAFDAISRVLTSQQTDWPLD